VTGRLADVLPALAGALGAELAGPELAGDGQAGPGQAGPGQAGKQPASKEPASVLGDRLDHGNPRGPAARHERLVLPSVSKAVVVLIDGLGDQLLRRRGGHAPFLRRLRAAPESVTLHSGYPSTTAASLGSFGTGLDVGAHGLVGTDVLDPGRGVLFNELAWDPHVDPLAWQPMPTVFEHLVESGVQAVHVGPGFMAGSGLTTAALRGARFVPAAGLADRVDAAITVAKAKSRSLTYLYWGELDKTGHVHGSESWQWGDELGAIDGELARLVRLLPPGTLVVVTADHGMVDVPFDVRIDVAHEPDLQRGVRLVGGEPRAVQLYCEPEAAPDVADRWRHRLGPAVRVMTRDEAIDQGWFGVVRPGVEARIGDLVLSAVADTAIVDSRSMRPAVLRLLGVHGAATAAETEIPLLVAVT
jgi:hypothetical protein